MPRGVPVLPEVPIAWFYIYPVVAIDPLTELLWWLWQANVPRGWRWSVSTGPTPQ